MADHSIDLTEDITRDLAGVRPVHPWFAVRPPTLGRAGVILTLLRSPERFAGLYGGQFDQRTIARESGLAESRAPRVLDLFAGTSSIAGEAALLGCDTDSLELNPVAHFIGLCSWVLPKAFGAQNEAATSARWRGLATETAEAAEALWASASLRIAHLFPVPGAVYLWVDVGPCPNCEATLEVGDVATIAPRLGVATQGSPAVRGRLTCGACGETASAVAVRRSITRCELRGVAEGVQTVVNADELRAMELAAEPAGDLVESLRREIGSAPEPAAIDPGLGVQRQATVLLALAAEFVAVRDRLAREGPDAAQTQALLDCLALCISATSQLARRDGCLRAGMQFATRSRLGQATRTAFAEPSLDAWDREWARRVRLLIAQIQRAQSAAGTVQTHLGDAAALPFADESFDAVICDPPYFDNVQYSDESRPYYGWLRLLVGDAHPQLFGRSSVPDDGQIVVRQTDGDREAERARYGTLLTASVEEAARVLAPERCLSFVFTAHASDQLSAFLLQVQPQGLELVDAIRVAQPRVAARGGDEKAGSYILLFRKSRAVTSVSEPSIDAGIVLGLAELGRSKLYAAVSEILEAEWDDETAEATIPSNFQGSRSRKIQELVAWHAEPASLLAELGAPTLRRHAERLGVGADKRRASATGLAEAILRAVGFTVPAPPRFTFSAERSEAARCAAELRIASTLEDVRGLFLTGSSAVERAVRHGTIAWLQAVGGSDWLVTLERLFESVRDKRFAGPGFFSFGDWQAIFFALPRLQEETRGALQLRLATLKRALGRKGAQAELERLVKTRNLVEHDTNGFLSGPFDGVRQTTADALTGGVSAMATLIDTGSWPQVLQALDERRDRYDRLTLRTLDEQNTTVELFVDHPTDLTRAYVWFSGGSNPREVEPLLVPLDEIAQATDLRLAPGR